MCNILMPINPKYVDKILTGNKKYEYRRVKAKRCDIEKMIIYSTSPIMRVVAEVDIEGILEDSPEKVWKITKKYSGITEDFFIKYYKDKKCAIAYKLGKIKIYDEPKKLSEIGIDFVPQSFIYLD